MYGPPDHDPRCCNCSHCSTGWDNFSSGDDDDDYWNSYDEDDEDDFLGEYTSQDQLYADHLLSSMTDKMFINSSSRLKKARGVMTVYSRLE